EQLLRFVRSVKRFAIGILARAGVVAADNEVSASVVFADERVPDGFAWAAHAHGERDKGEFGGAGWIFSKQMLVTADAGEVIDIAGLGHTDNRMDKEACFNLFRGPEGKFDMRAVHRVAGLEGNDAAPALARKIGAELGRRLAQAFEVVVARELKA